MQFFRACTLIHATISTSQVFTLQLPLHVDVVPLPFIFSCITRMLSQYYLAVRVHRSSLRFVFCVADRWTPRHVICRLDSIILDSSKHFDYILTRVCIRTTSTPNVL